MKSILTLFALLLLLQTTATAQDGLLEKFNFLRHIRPILSENCFTCHCPDAKKRKARLQLDDAESALAEREGYSSPIIAPSKPDKDVTAVPFTLEKHSSYRYH